MLLKLFCGDDFQIYESPTTTRHDNLPEFSSGETVDLEFTLMTRTDSSEAPWALVDPTTYALQIGLFTSSDRLQLAYQNTFTNVPASSKKTGSLLLDTGTIDDALAAVPSVRCTFEVRVEDATGPDYPYRNKNVTLTKSFITGDTTSVPPGEVAATQTWAKALFVPRDGSNVAVPCDQIIIKSRPGGLTKILWWDDDGVAHVENA